MGRSRNGATSVFFSMLVAGATIALPLSRASAQEDRLAQVEPYWAVTTMDGGAIRCGNADVFYAVKTLPKGTILRVDAETSDWVRVHYLPDMVALVKPDVAKEVDAGAAVRLSVTSRLQAASEKGGEKRSWQFLLNDAKGLAAGTRLPVRKVLKNEAGEIYGYLVPAPEQSRGFVRRAFIRQATPEEVAAHQRTLGVAPDAGAPTPIDPAAAGEPTPARNDAGAMDGPIAAQDDPATTPPAKATTPTNPGESVREPGVITDTTPAAFDAGAPQQPAPADLNEKWQSRVATVEHLQTLYTGVMAQPIATAEVDAAIREFEKAMGALTDSVQDQRLVADLDGRRNVLLVRRDLQKSLRELELSRASLDSLEDEVKAQQKANSAALAYDVVGRLFPSVVYDGRSLPKLYRVEAGEYGAARTVAYVMPTPGIDLAPLVGRTVGIRGSMREDSALGVNLIRPKEVVGLVPGR